MSISIGFIGTGAITSSLVAGFCSANASEYKICVSPRNAIRAAELAKKYNNVTISSSNQQVLDNSEWIVIAVVPSLGEEVIRPLQFKKTHRVINLMADRKLPEIAEWIGDTKTLVHMVPLPFAAQRIGPIAIYPDDKDVTALFAPLGQIIGVNNEKKIEAIATITALMTSYYMLMIEIIKWGEVAGLSIEESISYSSAFFGALSAQIGLADVKTLDRLINEMTPGGLCEMALNSIKSNGGIEPWTKILDPIHSRIKR